jgi:hypothetical protein
MMGDRSLSRTRIDTGYMDILCLGVGLDCALVGGRICNGPEIR